MLDEIFDVWWPKLSEKLEGVPNLTEAKAPKRTTEEILEEVVSNTREQIRRENVRMEQSKADLVRMDHMHENMNRMIARMGSLPNVSDILQEIIGNGKLGGLDFINSIHGSNVKEMGEMLSNLKIGLESSREFTESIVNTKDTDELK